LTFVLYPHAALAQAAVPAAVDARLLGVGAELLRAAMEAGAFGLAAAHIGTAAPVIVLNVVPETAPDYRVFYNPRVEAVAAEIAPGREASVSLPGIEVDIARPVWADIAWDDGGGARCRQRFDGFVARCALHEIEQMNGVFFLSHLSRLKRDMVLRKYYKHRPV
jgi:peptide deformylase